jgi:parvulin-like peptidyl-prolyl isomerase
VAIVTPNEPVATVNGVKISLRDYQAMVRYNRLNLRSQLASLQQQQALLDPTDPNTQFLSQYIAQQIQSLQAAASSLPLQTLENMINDELMRQEAKRRGIVVTQDEVDQQVEQWFGYYRTPPTATPTTVPETATAEAYAQATGWAEATSYIGTATAESAATEVALGTPTGTPLPTATVGPSPTPWPTSTPVSKEGYEAMRQQYLAYIAKQAGFSESLFMDQMRMRVLRTKLQAAFAAEVPTTANQVQVRQILLAKKEDAEAALARLQKGEDFAALAKELSQDVGTKDNGGDLGWLTQDSVTVDKAILDKAFQMQKGEYAIVNTSAGFALIQVVDRQDNRPLDPQLLQQRQSQALDDWLSTASASPNVKRFWSSTKVPLDTPTAQ